jgi:hypothetical protein
MFVSWVRAMEFWTLSLVVEVDEEGSLLKPRVRLAGGSWFAEGKVRATLVDPDEHIHITVGRPLRQEDIGSDIHLPSFPFPDGVGAWDVLRWGWDVAVHTDEIERIRWRRYLEVGTRVGADGEIRLAGPHRDLRSKAEDEGWGPEAPWDVRDSDRLLSELVADGIIREADRKAVLAEAASSERTVERTLVDLGHLTDHEMLERYAEVNGCELLDLDDHPIDPGAAARIPEQTARLYGLLGVGYHRGLVTVAMSDPQNLDATWAIQDLLGQPYIVLATREDVLRALDTVRPKLLAATRAVDRPG